MKTFAEKVIAFYQGLSIENNLLPEGIKAMNPFANRKTWNLFQTFYSRFYSDQHKRRIILGINPGRFGAGKTGIPFTDTKRLNKECGIDFHEFESHETSSVFIYEMIRAYGGVKKFYQDFYISSVSPLGFVKQKENGKEVNYNYYDSKNLEEALKPFILESLQKQIKFGIDLSVCYCLGTGKNYKYVMHLNKDHHFFEKIIPLEHPRYIMQYKRKEKEQYIRKYLNGFHSISS